MSARVDLPTLEIDGDDLVEHDLDPVLCESRQRPAHPFPRPLPDHHQGVSSTEKALVGPIYHGDAMPIVE
jgi:hypothetical protein